ncbi:M56 family metallopeptidase [Maribacter sp.]|uniref:M56 family metallopeptidase n=1 Tax=Maribacter sp. TaxID=1897614 RepID=UPI0025BA777B|nr:M56 family metallopeptidase [Maribacter sp.]
MHHFKRFFLLTALIISLIIPQIVFTEYIEAEPTTAVTQILTINEQPEITPIVHVMEESPMNWSLILYTIYGLGVAIFGFRFLYNIAKLWIRVRRNTQIKFNFLVKVLLKEELPPHTFLRYIFLNKQKFESKSIPAAVLLHEETHAKEWHSLDVLFIELLQVLFWFNPLIYLFKKTIKLNHEFLADSAVLNNQEDHLNYQNTLLSYLSNNSHNIHQSVGIANAINYSSIKKRIIIMKKQTSKRNILIRSLLLLPLLALMLYGFSQRNVVSKNTIKDINIEITKTGDLLINNERATLENLSTELEMVNHNFGPYITRNYITAHILYDETQYKLIDQVQSTLRASGISNIEHFSKKTITLLDKNGFEPSEYHGKTINEAKEIRKANVYNDLKTDIYHEPLLEIAWIEVKNKNQIWLNNEHVQLSQLNEKVKEKFPLAVKNNKLSAQIYTQRSIDSSFTAAISQELRKLKTKSITVFSKKYIMPKKEYKDTVDISPKVVLVKTNHLVLQTRENEQSTIPKITVNINKEGQLLVQDELVELEDLQKHLSEINSHLTINQRKQIVKTIIKVVPDSPKEVVMKVEQELLAYGAATIDIQEYNPKIDKRKKRATSVQMSKYDELAKKYNRMIADGSNIRILKSDINQLKHIYGLMSKEQKENAEPFPDFPEPPPAPKAPKAPNSSDYADNQIKEIIENQDPYDHLNLNINGIKGTSSKTTMELTSPAAPTPPTPPSPLDYAKDMAKKGAIFYFEGEKITSDKAIDILKKNKELNMESRKKLGKTEVRITTAPVTIR